MPGQCNPFVLQLVQAPSTTRLFPSLLQLYHQVNGDDGKAVKLDITAPLATSATPLFVRVTTVSTEVKILRSPDGRFHFEMLPDRNIVVRLAKELLWESGSRSRRQPPISGPFRLLLQENGDLVAYDDSSRVFWSAGTANCGPAPYTLTMQDDGHCVLYDGGGVSRWATNSRRKYMSGFSNLLSLSVSQQTL